MCSFSIDETRPIQEDDNETLKSCAGADRRFYCGDQDFQKRDDLRSINQHRPLDYVGAR